MKNRVVIFARSAPLLLRDPTFHDDGSVKRGVVINGEWVFKFDGKECFAGTEKSTVTRWIPTEPQNPVSIPPSVLGDYNDVIQWAQERQTDE